MDWERKQGQGDLEGGQQLARLTNMLANHWKEPVVIQDGRIRITLTSPEQAINWLAHERDQNSGKWRNAWQTCRAVHEGRLSAEEARSAVWLAAQRTH
jgi:subtilisin-like proprotein convertase family protein